MKRIRNLKFTFIGFLKKSFHLNSKHKGFTIIEILFASAISLVVLAGLLSFFLTFQRIWHGTRIQNQLNADMQIALEWVKKELTFSDGNQITIATNGVCFPRAVDNDNDGFIELDGDENIIWDQTVLYYVYVDEGVYQLKKTVYESWDENLDHDVLLSDVMEDGAGGSGSSTRIIVNGLDDLSLTATSLSHIYDGYAPEVQKSENVSFGSYLLDAGYHTIRFTVVDKDPDSSGYAVGMDSLSFTPCGYSREAEEYINLTHLDGTSGISGSSGDTITQEDMVSYGAWGGNYQLDYDATEVGDYIELRFYYDLIRETNFTQGSLDGVGTDFVNRTGYQDSEAGLDDICTFQEGYQTVWDAEGQTGWEGLLNAESGSDKTYRVVVSPPSWDEISSDGKLVSIKFRAGSDDALYINKAYLGEWNSGTPDCVASPTPVQFYFNNCDSDPRNSGQGCVPQGDGVMIPAGAYAWSNYIDFGDGFDESAEYAVTFYVQNTSSVSVWQGGTENIWAYVCNGDYAGVTSWSGVSGPSSYTSENDVYTVEEMFTTYLDTGTWTSRVYDSGLSDPDFSDIVWNIKRNNAPDANIQLWVRSNDNEDNIGSTAWTGPINTNSQVNGNSSISAVANGKYVQFMAEFISSESDEDAAHQTNDTDDAYDNDEDYDLSCVLNNVTIDWPGDTRIVEVSGYYTLKPDYGMFTISIDGESLTKGLQVSLQADREIDPDRIADTSLSTEVECRNTDR